MSERTAAAAIIKIDGPESIKSLTDYMMKFSNSDDQEAAKTSLMTVIGNDNISHLLPVLKNGNSSASEKYY